MESVKSVESIAFFSFFPFEGIADFAKNEYASCGKTAEAYDYADMDKPENTE